MRILIRCDSSFLIGSGHLIRCLNLADRVHARGHEVAFAMRTLPENLTHLARDRGYPVFELPDRSAGLPAGSRGYQLWLSATEEEEISDTEEAVLSWRPEGIIVDHYGIGPRWELRFRSSGIRVLALDDLGRAHGADWILDQNFHPGIQSSYQSGSPDSTLFLGPEYAILSPDFAKTDPAPEERFHSPVDQVFAFFGGVDATGESLKLLQAWRLVAAPAPSLELVLGAQNRRAPEILALAQPFGEQVSVKIQIQDMAERMARSGLFIGSGGTITWEKSKLGLPSLCIAVAENQEEIARALHVAGAHRYLGRAEEVTAQMLADEITELLRNAEARITQNRTLIRFRTGSRIEEILSGFERT